MRISDWSSDVCSSDLGAPVRVHHRAGLLQRGHVHLVDIGEVRDVALGRLHILGDLAAEADDLDLLVLAAGGRARAGDGAALVEEVGIEVGRSEEHTSELQSLMRISYAVFCLKKKNNN